MKEAMFYKSGDPARCFLCARRCLIPENKTGFCRVRRNINGKLIAENYGKVAATGIDPIEKKPFFHFMPGTKTFSFCTAGCNFRCQFCCNFHISQSLSDFGIDMTPEQIVKAALENNCQGISYTYTEPTIFFEYAYDTAKLAKKAGLYNCFVTNGYTTEEPIRKLSKHLDAAVIDIKGSLNSEFHKKIMSVPETEPILEAIKQYKKNNVFIEITDLIVPECHKTDDVKKLCLWILENLGKDVPLHFIRFFPSYKFGKKETELEVLIKCMDIAKDIGIKYVYLGNVSGFESTHCPECGKLLIERNGFNINIKANKKCSCGNKIPILSGKTIK